MEATQSENSEVPMQEVYEETAERLYIAARGKLRHDGDVYEVEITDYH
jgi:hypothetical protein